MLEGIASVLPNDDPRRAALMAAAEAHRRAGLAAVTGAHYEGGHWLRSFAVYLTMQRGIQKHQAPNSQQPKEPFGKPRALKRVLQLGRERSFRFARFFSGVPRVFLPETLQRTPGPAKDIAFCFDHIRDAFRIGGPRKLAEAIAAVLPHVPGAPW